MQFRKSFHKGLDLNSLLKHVQLTFGKAILNSNDCNHLADDVYKETGVSLSPQTLRRVFGLIESRTAASDHTILVLCKYCGFNSVSQFSLHANPENGLDHIKLHEARIYEAFFDIEVPPIGKHQINREYFNAIRNIVKRVYTDIDLYNALIPMIAHNPTAHEYLFEQFPFVDGFGRGFAIGYSFYIKNKLDPDAQVFGNAMLFLAAILQQDDASIKKYLDAINAVNLKDVKHPFIIARYIGSNLLFHHYHRNLELKNQWLNMAIDYLKNSPNEHGHYDLNIEYELMISEYLTLTSCYQWVIFILKPILEADTLNTKELDEGFWVNPMRIMLFKSLTYSNRVKEAKQILPTIKIINWLVQDYYTVHILDTKIKLSTIKAEKNELENTLKRLLNKTKFMFFNSLESISEVKS